MGWGPNARRRRMRRPCSSEVQRPCAWCINRATRRRVPTTATVREKCAGDLMMSSGPVSLTPGTDPSRRTRGSPPGSARSAPRALWSPRPALRAPRALRSARLALRAPCAPRSARPALRAPRALRSARLALRAPRALRSARLALRAPRALRGGVQRSDALHLRRVAATCSETRVAGATSCNSVAQGASVLSRARHEAGIGLGALSSG